MELRSFVWRVCSVSCGYVRLTHPSKHFLHLRKKTTLCRQMSDKNWSDQPTVKGVFKIWTDEFKRFDVGEPDMSAELIIAHVLGEKTFHRIDKQTQLKKCEMDQINDLCKLRMTRMPVQYIIGEWDFLDMTLKMQPHVFIPRPETEELANLCCGSLMAIAASGNLHQETFLEVSVGSGALSISLLKRFPKLHAVALDISSSACRLTEENAILHEVKDRLHIIEGDFNLRETTKKLSQKGPYCLLVSNPPYVRTEEMKNLQQEILCYEDPCALDGGHDGMKLIEELLLQSKVLLQNKGHIWLEVAPQHPLIIKEFLKKNGLERSLVFVDTQMDIFGKNRFCHFQQS